MKHCDFANCFSSFFMAPLYRLALSVAGFVVVAMTTINAEESACCGDQLSADSIDMEIRETANTKRSIRGNRYGPYELDYSKEDPQHAVKPFARLQEKDKIFDFKHQKGKVLIKVKQEWAKDRDFWKQLEFPGIAGMEQVFPTARGNRKIERMAAEMPEGEQRKPDLWRWVEASILPETTVREVVKGLRGRPEIEFIEPVFIYSTKGPVYEKEVPKGSEIGENEEIMRIQDLPSKEANTDPEWKGDALYHLEALNVPNAWKYLEGRQATNKTPGGSPDVIIAILDTGVDYNHEDLKPNMWVNGGEIAGNNIDDDKNGFIDDINGVSVVSNKEAHSGDPMDFNGHGTHCAGIAAAAGANEKGIIGVAYGCKIMAIKAGQYAGIFSTTDIAEGVYYAIENGADIINMSLGGPDSEVVRDALTVAFGDIVLIAAAGNSGRPNESPCMGASPSYPAAHNWVLGVEAREKYRQSWGWRAKFSNYDCVPYTKYEYEVMAPGVSIYSTWPGEGSYASLDGTSMAAPTVAGIAGLLRTQWPKSRFSSRFIMGQIIGSPFAQPRVPDALMALSNVPTPKLFMKEFWLFDTKDIQASNDNDGVVDAGETIDLALVIRNQWGKANSIKVKVEPLAKIEQGGSKLGDQVAYQADPYVTMITDEVSYDPLGSFNRGDNKLIYDSGGAIIGVKFPFKFKVNSNTPNDHFIPFRVTLTARNAYDLEDEKLYTTEQRFQLQVQSGSEIPTIITKDLTLTKDKFWIAVRPILIEKGATVTAEAGTQIQLGGPDPKTVYRDPFGRAFIQVEGRMETQGTADELVSIFPDPFWMPDPRRGGKNQNSVIRVREDGVFNMKYTSVMNPEVKGDRFDHVRFRYDITNDYPFYIRATELAYTECDLIIPSVVDMDTCLITRTKGRLRPGGLWVNEKDDRDPFKESRFGSGMRNSVILGHMVDMDRRYSPSMQAYQGMPYELIKDKQFIEPTIYNGKTYVTVYPRTWQSKPGELTSVRGWNTVKGGKDGYEAMYSKSAMKTASLVAGYFGGDVLEINDVNENTFVANYIKDTLGSINEVIIPLNDLDSDGKFTWNNGLAPVFTNWGGGFPDTSKDSFFTKINGAGAWSNTKWINTNDYGSYAHDAAEQQGYSRSWYRRIKVGWYASNTRNENYYFKGELPVIIELPGEKSLQFLNDNHDKMYADLSAKHHAVRNNALLSSTWDPNTKNLIRISAESVFQYHYGDSARDINYTGNYWGPIADKRVNAMIHDGVDIGVGQKILYTPRLNPELNEDYLKMEEIWPFVVDIKITTDDNKRNSLANVPDVGMGMALFEITFNRDMDVTKPLRANFGPDAPFTDYPIRPYGENNGWQQDLRTWLGTFEITPVTGDGYQMVRTYKAVAKSDPWLESGRDTGRFRFTINTISIESLNLQVNAAEGANKLIWVQRDFNTLAGFNLYRSSEKDGSYKKINRAMVPKNKRSYLDNDVAQGSKYFYKFKVVDTMGVESAFSNLDDATPIRVVLPTIKHVPITTGEVQKDVNILAQVTDNVDIKGVSVFYRLIGAKSYNKAVAAKIDGNLPGFLKFQATIPGAEIFAPGMEYYIEVFDGVNSNNHATPDTPNKIILKNTLYLGYLDPNSGPSEGGTKVTVSGQNFEQGIDVYFGNQKATSVVVNSDTELTCNTPKYFPSFVDVRVENSSRQVSRLTSGFSFTSPKINLAISDRKVPLNRNVIVPLNAGAFSGLASMDTIIYYNSAELNPVEVSSGDLLSKWSFSSNMEDAGKIIISAASPAGTLSGTGNLANIEFKAIGEAGKVSQVTIGKTTLNEGAINYIAVNGSVSIASSEDSKATIDITNLKHVYDGSPKSATVSISLTVDQTIVTYKGRAADGTVYNESKTPPTNAGLYTATAEVHDKKYTGYKEAFLEISKAPVVIELSDLNHLKDGGSKSPNISVSVSGLKLKTLYRDLSDNILEGPPSEEGTYKVKVEVDENNYQGTAFGDLTIQKIVGALTLDNLSQTYDGTRKSVRVITVPDGIEHTVKYDGSDILPTDAGTYNVTAVFNNPRYKGSATGVLVVRKREAQITIQNLTQDYSGDPKMVKVTTVPTSLKYIVTYDDESAPPKTYGSYSVKVKINDSNHYGELSKTLTIKKPDANISLTNLAKVYDGKQSPVGVSITPSGINYSITYSESDIPPTDPGKYAVNLTVNDDIYQGVATGELIITKAIGTIEISNQNQEYDGKLKDISVATVPAGLKHIVKYDGVASKPVSAGTYNVIVTLDDSRYQGSKAEVLTISKQQAVVSFSNLLTTADGTPKPPVITTTPADLNLTVKYKDSEGQKMATAPSKPGIYEVEVEVQETNYSGKFTKTIKINAKDPFGDPVIYPQTPATLLGIIDISGSPVPEGDVIAAYVGDELRGKQKVVIDDNKSYVPLSISVLQEGERMRLKLWRRDTGAEEDYEGEFIISPGMNIGTADNLTVLSFGGSIGQNITLKKGWNPISLSVIADDMSPAKLFEPVKNSLYVVKDITNIYDPAVPEFLNTLKKLTLGTGYWVNMKENRILAISGSMPKQVSVNLRTGWNLIGYPDARKKAPSEVFKSIIGDLDSVYGGLKLYKTVNPDFLNTLKLMEPGVGYWVKMKNAAVLTFGDKEAGGRDIVKFAPKDDIQSSWGSVVVYPNIPATIYGVVSVDNINVEDEDYIGVFVGEELRGLQSIVLNDDMAYISLGVNMKGDEAMQLRYWDSSEKKSYVMDKPIVGSIGQTMGEYPNLLDLRFTSEDLVDNNYLRIGNNNNTLMINFNGEMSRTYILEKTINLKDWTPVEEYKGTDSINYKLNPPFNNKQEYYRIRIK